MNYICQLKHDLKQDEKRQAVLEELHDYYNLKYFDPVPLHIKTSYKQCNEAELKTFKRSKPHKSHTHAFHSVVLKEEVTDMGHRFRNYKEQLEWDKGTRWFLYGF